MEYQSTEGKPGEFTLKGLGGHIFYLSNVPSNIKPVLLDIDDYEIVRLKKLRKDGVGPLTSVAGNLVFLDDNGNEVDSFPAPITLVLNITSEDEEERYARQTTLMERNILAKDQEVELIPAYLDSYNPDRGETPLFEIWKPFQNFTRDDENQTLTVRFRFWGDRQVGPTTKP